MRRGERNLLETNPFHVTSLSFACSALLPISTMYISVCAVSCNYMHLQFQIQLYHIFHVQCESRYVRGVLAPRKTIKIAALRCNGLYEEVCNIQSFLEQLVQGLVDVCMWQDSNSVSYRV